MKNLKLKELILKETEQLKTKQKNVKNINNVLWGVSLIGFALLGGYLGYFVFPSVEDSVIRFMPGFLCIIIGFLVGLAVNYGIVENIFDHNAIDKQADKKVH